MTDVNELTVHSLVGRKLDDVHTGGGVEVGGEADAWPDLMPTCVFP